MQAFRDKEDALFHGELTYRRKECLAFCFNAAPRAADEATDRMRERSMHAQFRAMGVPFMRVLDDTITNIALPKPFYAIDDEQTRTLHRLAHTVVELAAHLPRSVPSIDMVERALPRAVVESAHATFEAHRIWTPEYVTAQNKQNAEQHEQQQQQQQQQLSSCVVA